MCSSRTVLPANLRNWFDHPMKTLSGVVRYRCSLQERILDTAVTWNKKDQKSFSITLCEPPERPTKASAQANEV